MPCPCLQQQPCRLHSGPCCNALRWKGCVVLAGSACCCQVRRWDANAMINTDTHNSSKAIYCIAAAANSASVVAFGGADRAWHLWDRRQSRKEDMVKSLAGFPVTALVSYVEFSWERHVTKSVDMVAQHAPAICLQQNSQSVSLLCSHCSAFIMTCPDSVLACVHIMLALTEMLIWAGCEGVQFPLRLDNFHCLV